MTAFYKVRGFRLGNASISTKVLLTGYLFLVLAGLAVALVFYAERAGLDRQGTIEWIHGNEGDLQATEFKSEKSYGELLAITHQHAFSLPMLLFLLLHLVQLCAPGERFKVAFYLFGFASLVGCFAGPWMLYAQGAGWSWLTRVSGVGLSVTLVVAAGLCLFELWLAGWWSRRRGRAAAAAADPMFGGPRGRGAGGTEAEA